jgi:glycosyltransferase involved in cell wall biosynthesis
MSAHKDHHILLLTDCLADLAGGAEKQIYELAKGLDKNIYEVHVVSLDCWGQAPKEIIEKTGSQLHIFRVVRVYGLSGFVQGFRFHRFLKDNHIDIILTYHFSSDLWGTFWGHLAGVKTIISNRRDMGFWRNGLHIGAYKLVNHWVSKIVTVSESIKQLVIKEEGVDPGCIEVIYNGVEVPEKNKKYLQELRAQLNLKHDDIVIMHVANLKPVKGHKYLLEAFAEISKQYPQVKLVLIGKDELNGQLQEMAKTLNILDKVSFLGKRDDITGLLSVADICVLPSLSEGMSNSILEYMAAEKPVITTNVGGNPELIKDGLNGLLVEKENSQQLKDALLVLINDQQKRFDMGFAGYERVKKEFSMPAMLSRYEHLFSGIKVLHLVSSGGLFGAERVILNLASKGEGITSYVGALNNHHNPHLEIIEEAKRLGLNTVVFDSKGKFDLTTIKTIKKFIIENKIDIVHTHNYKSDLMGMFATKFSSTTKWMATHHGWIGTDQKLEFYEKIDSFILKSSQKVVLVSQKVKQKFLHLKKERIVIIDNGIPIEKFDQLNRSEDIRRSLGIGSQDCAIVIVGRLAVEKGHEILLKAAVEVIKNTQDVKFIIVGDGPLREVLKKKSHDLALSDYVVFTGIREDMPDIYASCNMMVNASYAEGLPMTILEAMASRLPVIATDVGAVGKVIKNQENGILLPAGDAHQLALKMIELIQDKDKRQRFAQKAYQDVCERYSDTQMAERYKKIYYEIV